MVAWKIHERRMGMCSCFEDVKKKTVKLIEGGMPNHTEFEAEWGNRMFFLGSSTPRIPVVLSVNYSYRKIKVSGEPYKNLERNKMSVVMSYCPFCGKKQSKD
jgi:hypothetical protein